MIFNHTTLKDAFLIDIEKREDSRGFFARAWDVKEFEQNVSNSNLVQCNISRSNKKGTIRGMHYQKNPHEEAKLIRCTKGKIYDVIIDLRPNSKSYKKWEAFELSSSNYKLLYVPEGFAHGFQSLEDNTEIFYQVSQFYSPGAEIGIRWNDPCFNIGWPLEITEISDKDRNIEDFKC
jgi:dTDP-4-dehydrorhamnose 3,5-epimerase